MSTVQIIGISLRLLPALVWGVAGIQTLRFLRAYRPPGMLYRLFPALAASVTSGFLIGVVFWLGSWSIEPPSGVTALLYAGNDLCIIAALALFRHMVRYLPIREEPPSRPWLAVNYGAAAAVGTLALTFDRVVPAATFADRLMVYRAVYVGYELVILVLCVRALARIARRGTWRPGGGVIALRYVDIALLAAAGIAIAGALVLIGWRANAPHLWLLVDGVIGIAVTVPIAARFLGEVVRATAFMVLAAVFAGLLGVGTNALSGVLAPGAQRVLAAAATVLLLLAVMLLQPRISETIDRLLFRRSHRRRHELQTFVHDLSPELGTVECCRRALEAVVRTDQLRGAAVILRGAEAITAGDIDLDRVRAVWPSGDAFEGTPAQLLVDYGLHGLPLALREALSDTNIVAIIPIESRRARHGHLLLSTSLLGAYFPREDVDTLVAFTNQLALVLDASALLERAVSVERSLAHAEKLAAIGELAARIAHEIRNPVTAARSLAQLLSREPTSPLNAEHAELILVELERVERQVAALLRFARREELHFQNADLGALVRETAQHFETRLADAGVACTVDAPDGIIARIDHDKLRQVLINLVENALDALAERQGERRIHLSVSQRDGSSTLRVEDTGPGIAGDALVRIFEPFFSLKAQGTGLGLAIVKRTVEAHGGAVRATSSSEGAAFEIDLPRDRALRSASTGRVAHWT